jgi:hypothetical protein
LSTLKDWTRQLEEAVSPISQKYIAECKSFSNPPETVKEVLNSVLICLGEPIGWTSAKKWLSNYSHCSTQLK